MELKEVAYMSLKIRYDRSPNPAFGHVLIKLHRLLKNNICPPEVRSTKSWLLLVFDEEYFMLLMLLISTNNTKRLTMFKKKRFEILISFQIIHQLCTSWVFYAISKPYCWGICYHGYQPYS